MLGRSDDIRILNFTVSTFPTYKFGLTSFAAGKLMLIRFAWEILFCRELTGNKNYFVLFPASDECIPFFQGTRKYLPNYLCILPARNFNFLIVCWECGTNTILSRNEKDETCNIFVFSFHKNQLNFSFRESRSVGARLLFFSFTKLKLSFVCYLLCMNVVVNEYMQFL